MKRLVLLSAMLLIAALLIAKQETIQRERTYLREGAGAYYPIIKEIPIKTAVDVKSEESGWLQVMYASKAGYIPTTALQQPVKRNDVFSNMQAPKKGVTAHGVAAGVKGFSDKFNGELNGNPEFADYALTYRINTDRYKSFSSATYKTHKVSTYRKINPLPSRKEQDYYTESAEGFGLAVAGIVANLGLYENNDLLEYINFVGNIVVESSDVPDIGFKFFVLDISEPNGYACPGGYIFLTKGMLKLVHNEAELAFVLAHEIAHVSRFHGMIETKLRENQIGAENLFDELDSELPGAYSDKAKDIEAELEAEIMTMYNTLIEGRLDAYEEEADKLGLLFIARSGYDPLSAKQIIQRLLNTRYESNNQHYRRDSVRAREVWINKESIKYQKQKVSYFNHEQRFLQRTVWLGEH